MKKITFLYLLLISLVGAPMVKAQVAIKTTNDSVKFGNTLSPGIWVNVPESELENVRKDWIKVLEKGTKSKAIVNGNEVTIFGAQFKDLSEEPVNVYSKLETKDSTVMLFTSVELRRDEFTKANTKEHNQLIESVKGFAKEQYLEVAGDQLSKQESKLKDFEKNLASARKDKEKLEKSLQSANTTISEEEYKIVTTQKEMEVTDGSLDALGTRLSTTTDKDAKKSLESEIKDLQKKKKSNLKDISSSENKISKAKEQISDNKSAIETNLLQQEEMQVLISAQTRQVANYTTKVSTIKSY